MRPKSRTDGSRYCYAPEKMVFVHAGMRSEWLCAAAGSGTAALTVVALEHQQTLTPTYFVIAQDDLIQSFERTNELNMVGLMVASQPRFFSGVFLRLKPQR